MTAQRHLEPVVDARIPPHNSEAEKSVIGAALQSASALAEVRTIITAADFYEPKHETIWHSIERLVDDRNQPVDAIILADELNRIGELNRVGGHPYLHEAIASADLPANATYYAEIVADSATRRRLIDTATRIQQLAYQSSDDPHALVAKARALVETTEIGVEGIEDPRSTSSWRPIELTQYIDGSYSPPTPTLMPSTDGTCLLYPGLTHSFHGEPESGKSLLSQIETVRLINSGEPVLYLDFESDQESVAFRLLEFGATGKTINDHFTYVRPETRPDALSAAMSDFRKLLNNRYALVVIDGVTDALALWGAETKDNDGITRWSRALPKLFAERTGAAVVMVDHVTKDNDTRGRFAIGGQAKLATLTGAAYTVKVIDPLGRGLRGIIALRVAKDRPGHVRGQARPISTSDRTQEIARVIVDSTGSSPIITIEPWKDAHAPMPSQAFRPTGIMERISRALENTPQPLSFNEINNVVTGKREYVRDAIDALIREGHISTKPGARSSTLHTSAKPFREADQFREPVDLETESLTGSTGSGSYTGEPGTSHLTDSRNQSGTSGNQSDEVANHQPSEPPNCTECGLPLPTSAVIDGYTSHPNCGPDDKPTAPRRCSVKGHDTNPRPQSCTACGADAKENR